MPNMYKTARGVSVDLNALKLNNERVVAVGNAGVNARGDLVQNGRIIKTREQLMQETYNIKGTNIAKDAKIRQSANDLEPDLISAPPIDLNNPYEDLITMPEEVNNIEQTVSDNKPRGGLADAINRSKEITDKMEARRKRI